jgi:hypothetical protein
MSSEKAGVGAIDSIGCSVDSQRERLDDRRPERSIGCEGAPGTPDRPPAATIPDPNGNRPRHHWPTSGHQRKIQPEMVSVGAPKSAPGEKKETGSFVRRHPAALDDARVPVKLQLLWSPAGRRGAVVSTQKKLRRRGTNRTVKRCAEGWRYPCHAGCQGTLSL